MAENRQDYQTSILDNVYRDVSDYLFKFNLFKPVEILSARKSSRTYGVRYCGYCGRTYYITDREKYPVCGRRVEKKYRNA